jgi:hypothetical protein
MRPLSWRGTRIVLLAFAACLGACLPQGGTVNVEHPGMVVHVEVSDAVTGTPLVATVKYWTAGLEANAPRCTTSAAGTCDFLISAATKDSHMWVASEGYLAQDRHVTAGPGIIIKWLLVKPPPPLPEPVGPDAPWKANFCGSREPWEGGGPLFDIFLATYTTEQRQQVYVQKRSEGLNRIVLAAKGDYHGTRPFDYSHNPTALAALMQEVRAAGFRPVVFLSSGDGGTGGDADAYFGSLLDGLGPVKDQADYSPCWECVKGGWTTNQFMHAVDVIAAHVAPTTPIWFHGSDGRGTFASYPLEADDPTGGDEPGAWKTPTGKRLAGLLYQSESGRVLLQADQEPLDYLGQRGWRGRATEVVMRVQDGQRGWVKKRVVLFESVAEDYYNGRATDSDVMRIATEGLGLGFREFGNGIPIR